MSTVEEHVHDDAESQHSRKSSRSNKSSRSKKKEDVVQVEPVMEDQESHPIEEVASTRSSVKKAVEATEEAATEATEEHESADGSTVESDYEGDDDDESYEEVDVRDDHLYQVLSALFEDDEGSNIAENLVSLRTSMDTNTEVLSSISQSLETIARYYKNKYKKSKEAAQ